MAKRSQQFDPRQTMADKTFEIFHSYDTSLKAVDVHHHDFFEIYYFIRGQVEYRVEGRSYCLEPGDLLLISPWEFHQTMVQLGTPYERIVLWIDRNYLQRFAAGDEDLAACFDRSIPNLLRPSKVQRTTILSMLELLVKESQSKRYGSTLYAQGVFLQFMVEVNRMARRTARQREPAEEPELVNQVLAYIAGHYEEKLTLQALADRFYVNKYHLAHEFSSKVGTSVYRYIILKRLLTARELLTAGEAPGEVYQSCGFRDYANFYRAFKAEYGVGPREFAEQQRG